MSEDEVYKIKSIVFKSMVFGSKLGWRGVLIANFCFCGEANLESSAFLQGHFTKSWNIHHSHSTLLTDDGKFCGVVCHYRKSPRSQAEILQVCTTVSFDLENYLRSSWTCSQGHSYPSPSPSWRETSSEQNNLRKDGWEGKVHYAGILQCLGQEDLLKQF